MFPEFFPVSTQHSFFQAEGEKKKRKKNKDKIVQEEMPKDFGKEMADEYQR